MTDSQKADQIAFHFYTKLFNVVNHARTTLPQPAKLDKWVRPTDSFGVITTG